MNELRVIERSLMKRQEILSKKIDDENTVFEKNSTTNERGKYSQNFMITSYSYSYIIPSGSLQNIKLNQG